ncbi:VanZ like family protein [compost metagenome]
MPTTGWDKSNHVLAFVVLTFLARKVWAEQFWLVLLSLLGYGALIELLQSLTPYRHAEWSDLWADGLGLLVGTIFTRRNSPLNTVVDDLRV